MQKRDKFVIPTAARDLWRAIGHGEIPSVVGMTKAELAPSRDKTTVVEYS